MLISLSKYVHADGFSDIISFSPTPPEEGGMAKSSIIHCKLDCITPGSNFFLA